MSTYRAPPKPDRAGPSARGSFRLQGSGPLGTGFSPICKAIEPAARFDAAALMGTLLEVTHLGPFAENACSCIGLYADCLERQQNRPILT